MRFILLIVNIVIGFIEFLLGIRFLLKFFGAKETSEFVNWIYVNSSAFLKPFENIFSPLRFGTFTIEFSTLIAMAVYAFVGYLIHLLINSISDSYYRR